MALTSSAVNTDDQATAAQYNNLRTDVTGHTHEGTDTALLKADSITTVTGSRVLSLPTGATDTIATLTATQTFTGKTLTDPTINAGGGVLVLPQSAEPAQTAEGSIAWDTTEDRLVIGTGVAARSLTPDDVAGTLTLKTLTAPTIADFTNANHDHGDADDGGALASGIALASPVLTTPTSGTGIWGINETANGNMTTGLTINQGAADNEILALKSSDVAHGITTYTETDTYGYLEKAAPTEGGLAVIGISEGLSDPEALRLVGYLGNVASTLKTTGGLGVVNLRAAVKSGTTIADVGANGNLASIDNNGTVRFIFDAEGSAHADVEWIAFAEHDDLALISDIEQELLSHESPAGTASRQALEAVGIIGRDSWHMEKGRPRAMVNMTKLAMLHHGALMQLGQEMKVLKSNMLTEIGQLRAEKVQLQMENSQLLALQVKKD